MSPSKPQELLALCACLQLDADRRSRLSQYVAEFTAWEDLPAAAEEQGLAPLVYSYLTQINAQIPQLHQLPLRGLYLRHRHTNWVRGQVLEEIISAFNEANIDVLVLKGAALAHLIYREPGYRPMRDLDLLVRRVDALHAQEILTRLGFAAPWQPDEQLLDKHLDNAVRPQNGFLVSVEVHYNLFDSFAPRSMSMESLRSQPIPFGCGNITAYTLGAEDMLLHLCEHIAYHASIWEPIRLIWVVDVVGFAEKFAREIDWKAVQQNDPIVLNLLSLFHHICPLSDSLQSLSQVKLGPAPRGIGEEYSGWPRHSIAQLRGQPLQQILRKTFFPSEWWLRLHYRLNSVQPLFLYRWFFHPFYILGPFYLVEKARLFWYLRLRRTRLKRREKFQ